MTQATIIYLHGLASSPNSAKAQFFGPKLKATGFEFIAPDLNAPDFLSLTLSRVIEQTLSLASQSAGSLIFMGSSFGGLAALHAAQRAPEPMQSRLKKLVLLAPALDFINNKEMKAGDVELWRQRGSVPICLKGSPAMENNHLSFRFVEDLAQYDSYAARPKLPTFIAHGTNDETIDVRQSRRFKELYSDLVTFLEVPSDHALTSAFEPIWESLRSFLKQP